MTPNEELIHRFYSSFQRGDAEAMAACYHPDIHFSDPVFTDLRGQRAGDMWRMLCSSNSGLKIEFSDVTASDDAGSAHWEARYTFTPTRRNVHNRIDASFQFEDGLIIRHVDRFNLRSWAAQALGPMGWLFGWTPFLQKKVRATAERSLKAYESRSG